MRKRLDIMNFEKMLYEMSEGNPGANSVIAQIMALDKGLIHLLTLDDMNIRGTQIWIAWKYFAEFDFDKFIAAVESRSQEMVDLVNELNAEQGDPNVAVTSGASFKHGEEDVNNNTI